MSKMLPVTIYKDTTDLFTRENLAEFECSYDLFSEMMEIMVPEDLLFEWWSSYEENPTKDEFMKWLYEESTADDTYGLYHWLKKHNYTVTKGE